MVPDDLVMPGEEIKQCYFAALMELDVLLTSAQLPNKARWGSMTKSCGELSGSELIHSRYSRVFAQAFTTFDSGYVAEGVGIDDEHAEFKLRLRKEIYRIREVPGGGGRHKLDFGLIDVNLVSACAIHTHSY